VDAIRRSRLGTRRAHLRIKPNRYVCSSVIIHELQAMTFSLKASSMEQCPQATKSEIRAFQVGRGTLGIHA